MSLLGFTPDNTRLITATGQGLVGGNRLALSARRLSAESAGVLLPQRAGDDRSPAVRLVPVPDLPEDVLVVPEPLALEYGLAQAPWSVRPAEAAVPAAVELESPAELSLDEATRRVRSSPLLCGHVFRFGDGQGQGDEWIDVGGHPFRVRSVTDRSGQALSGLLRITEQTRFSVFAPGVRSAVDIVVLADCSGSMGANDIPDVREGLRIRRDLRVTRMDALKRALRTMIDARAQVDGLVTRFALVRFDLTTRVLFPAGDGMAEVTNAPGDRSLEQLRGAVTLLKHGDQATDIGKALHTAGELLYRHGVPDNDKLIVLVSDGAHWAPMSEDRSGESVHGTEDPVSTMEELHTELGIRLHAVGISDQTLFARWWDDYCRQQGMRAEPPHHLVPNHELLGQLVDVAGGDRHRIGGVEVLEEYFAELGSGVVRSVGGPAAARLPALQIDPAAVAAASRRTVVDPARQQGWETRVEKLLALYSEICTASVPRLGYGLFQAAPPGLLQRLRRIAVTHMDFVAWLAAADQVIYERMHDSVRIKNDDPKYPQTLPVPELTTPLWDGRLYQVHGLRNFFLHNPEHEMRKEKQNRQVGEVILKHTGKYALSDDDAEGWQRLQSGLLGNITAVLGEILDLLVSPPVRPEPAPAGPEPAAPAAAAEPSGVRVVHQGWE